MSQNNRPLSYREHNVTDVNKTGIKREGWVLGVILVVDDSPTICRLVATTLEKRGYQVHAATDGMDALAKMNECIPDLIFLDITMPRLDGYQLCKIIKSNADLKQTPIVMLSGKDGLLDKVKGRMAGASDYITKPFKPNTLLQTVAKHVKR